MMSSTLRDACDTMLQVQVYDLSREVYTTRVNKTW